MDQNSKSCNLRRIVDTVSRIAFPNLSVRVEVRDHGLCLRVHCDNGVDNDTGLPSPWRGRAWPLEFDATTGEVVQTAFKAIMTSLEHEARELFLFQGERVMNPHMDLYLVPNGEWSHVHTG